MNHSDIDELVNKFIQAAARAKQAGYDCIQVHGAHTFLISQMISPYYNKRTDEFGPESVIILQRIYDGIKALDISVGIKLQSDEYSEEGITPIMTLQLLQKTKYDFVELSGGSHFGAHITIRKS